MGGSSILGVSSANLWLIYGKSEGLTLCFLGEGWCSTWHLDSASWGSSDIFHGGKTKIYMDGALQIFANSDFCPYGSCTSYSVFSCLIYIYIMSWYIYIWAVFKTPASWWLYGIVLANISIYWGVSSSGMKNPIDQPVERDHRGFWTLLNKCGHMSSGYKQKINRCSINH